MGYNTEFEQEYFLMRTGVPLPETVASAYDLLECLHSEVRCHYQYHQAAAIVGGT